MENIEDIGAGEMVQKVVCKVKQHLVRDFVDEFEPFYFQILRHRV